MGRPRIQVRQDDGTRLIWIIDKSLYDIFYELLVYSSHRFSILLSIIILVYIISSQIKHKKYLALGEIFIVKLQLVLLQLLLPLELLPLADFYEAYRHALQQRVFLGLL